MIRISRGYIHSIYIVNTAVNLKIKPKNTPAEMTGAITLEF